MKEGIQSNYPDERVRKYGCAFLCLCQYLKPELEDIPENMINNIPDSLLDKNEMYVKDWVNLYNFCNDYLEAGKKKCNAVMRGVHFKPGEIMICKNIKADKITAHFTLAKDGVTAFDPLDPNRAAARQYVEHLPYDFI
jgi:hypothetical protein